MHLNSKRLTERDRTPHIEKNIVKKLRHWKQNDYIDAATFDRIRPTGTGMPRLYGLPKVHKDGLPMRIILDMLDSPYHATAQWLSELLQPIRRILTPHSLKDTFQFIECIRNANLSNARMLSLDVSALFTNVPLRETMSYLCDEIVKRNIHLGIPIQEVEEPLLMCTSNVQFSFNGDLYRQIDGVAMGSPLGPLLAEVFMSKLESGPLRNSISNFCVYKRYVDDIFCIVDSELEADVLLNEFNSAHPSINFTMEIESEGSLAFLDVLLHRLEDGSIQRSVYRKKTWTSQYTHFHSFVPIKQKRNLIRCLTDRARKICSLDTLEAELGKIADILRTNGYPEKFINRNMSLGNLDVPVQKANKKPIYITLPYKGESATEILSRRLKTAIERTYNAAKVNISFKTFPVLIPHLKDRRPYLCASFCIYSFTCCCQAGYVGRTSRRLVDRIKEHNPKWLRNGSTKPIKSAIGSHLIDSNNQHGQFDVDDCFKVIYRVPFNRSRAIRHRILATAEAIGIRLRHPQLCAQKSHVQALLLPWPRDNWFDAVTKTGLNSGVDE